MLGSEDKIIAFFLKMGYIFKGLQELEPKYGEETVSLAFHFYILVLTEQGTKV